MKNLFYKKTILITGGTGSFGKKLLKKILKFNFKQINILSRDEKKQEDLRNEIDNSKIKFFIGDVRDKESMDGAFKGVDYIFHAAALKQVPSCEFYPLEAIKTNCHGTKNVINLAIKNKIKKMILLSTDKAVYPINSMGMSKALAEKIMIAKVRQNHLDDMLHHFEDLFSLAKQKDGMMQMVAKMKELVPEFVSNNSVFEQLDGDKAAVIEMNRAVS